MKLNREFSEPKYRLLSTQHLHKMVEMRPTSMATRTLLHKNAEGRRPFSNINICLGGIKKLFESKNRIINLTLFSASI